MLTAPDRFAPLFEATVTVTVPPPDTLETSVLSQSWSSLTVHEQSERPFAVTSYVPPPWAACTGDGLSESGDDEHGAASCVMFTRSPPIVTLPDRSPPSFRATVICTASLGETLEEPTLIQLTLELTLIDDEQSERPDDAVTLNASPSCPTRLDDGDTESGDDGHGAAFWVTLTLRPPMVTVPDRCAPVFSAAVTFTVLPPEKLEGSTLSQPALDLAPYDEQRPLVVTPNVSPPAATVFDVGSTESRVDPHATWVTSTVCPPMVRFPVRSEPTFATTSMSAGSPPRMLEATGRSQFTSELTPYGQSERPVVVTRNLPAFGRHPRRRRNHRAQRRRARAGTLRDADAVPVDSRRAFPLAVGVRIHTDVHRLATLGAGGHDGDPVPIGTE